MLDKKATDVLILHVAPLTSVADYLVLGSAESDRQTRAIADHIDGVLSRTGLAAEHRRQGFVTVGADGLWRRCRPYLPAGYASALRT